MAFYRQDYRSGLLFHPPGDLPDSGMELASPASPTWQADSLPLSHLGSPILLAETGQKLGYVIIGNSPLFRRRQWQPTPVLLLGKSHGRRSLVGCSPWGRKESDTTERLHFHALENEMATHSSVLAWRIPGTGEPGGLPSMGSRRVGRDWSDLAAAAAPLFSVYYVPDICFKQILCGLSRLILSLALWNSIITPILKMKKTAQNG